MWACGIILLAILSGKTNFFNAPDDLTSLAQIANIFGKEALCSAAGKMGKRLIMDIPSHSQSPSTLKVNVMHIPSQLVHVFKWR